MHELLWCSSLASQPPKQLEHILSTAKAAGVTIVSLPLVNEWTQVITHVSRGTMPVLWSSSCN